MIEDVVYFRLIDGMTKVAQSLVDCDSAPRRVDLRGVLDQFMIGLILRSAHFQWLIKPSDLPRSVRLHARHAMLPQADSSGLHGKQAVWRSSMTECGRKVTDGWQG